MTLGIIICNTIHRRASHSTSLFDSRKRRVTWLSWTEHTLVFVQTRSDRQLRRKRRQLERVVARKFVVACRRRAIFVPSFVLVSETFREGLGEKKVDGGRDRDAGFLEIVVVPVEQPNSASGYDSTPSSLGRPGERERARTKTG